MQFRRFGKSPQGTDLSPLSLCRFTKNYKSHTAITSMVASLRSQILRIVANAESTLFGGLKSLGISWTLLFAKAKRSKKFVLGASHGLFSR